MGLQTRLQANEAQGWEQQVQRFYTTRPQLLPRAEQSRTASRLSHFVGLTY